MKNYRYNILIVTMTFFGMVLVSLPASAGRIDAEFPVYDGIRPNVVFWKKIYTQYSTTQGVIHDKKNLAIIYEVIDLKDRNRHGSRKINQQRIKKVKKKYRRILAKLAQGKAPGNLQEQRVAALFGSRAKPIDFRNAMRNLRCQVGQNDPFRQGIIRSGAYLSEMKQIFRDAGLPEDLVYLPHVESSFNPKAYSKFGAAGMWQFTRSTGKRFMRVGYEVDERRDPIRATHAAAALPDGTVLLTGGTLADNDQLVLEGAVFSLCEDVAAVGGVGCHPGNTFGGQGGGMGCQQHIVKLQQQTF